MNELEKARLAVEQANQAVMAASETIQKLVAENEKLKSTITEINNELYGQGFEVLGWHLNGDTEKLDAWFEDNDWDPETPATDAAIAEIKAQGVDELANKLDGLPFNCGVNHQYVVSFAANLRAGRKG